MSRLGVVFPVGLPGLLGGIQQTVAILLRELGQHRQYRPILAAPDGPFADQAAQFGVDVVPFPPDSGNIGFDFIKRASALLGLARTVRGPTVWHFHRVEDAIAALVLPQLTTLFHQHGVFAQVSKRTELATRLVARVAGGIAAPSAAVFATDPLAKRCAVLPNPIDLPERGNHEQLIQARVAERAKRNSSAIRVLMVGRPVAAKGWYWVPEALAKLSVAAPDRVRFTGVIADDHPGAQPYQNRVMNHYRSRLSANRKVSTEWVLNPSITSEFLTNADVVWIPSLSEAFSRVAAEAIGYGAPVVASEIPALREVLGGAGLYVQPGDVDGLAALTMEALHRSSDEAWVRNLVQQADQFRTANVLPAYRSLYRQLLNHER